MPVPGSRLLRTVIAPTHPEFSGYRALCFARMPGPGCAHALHGHPDRCSQCLIDPRFVARLESSIRERLYDVEVSARTIFAPIRMLGMMPARSR